MSGLGACLVMTPSEAAAAVPGWGDEWLVAASDRSGRIRMFAVPAEEAATRLPEIVGDRSVFPGLPGYKRADLSFAEELAFVEHVERHARPRAVRSPAAPRKMKKSRVKTTAVRPVLPEALIWAFAGFAAGLTGISAAFLLP